MCVSQPEPQSLSHKSSVSVTQLEYAIQINQNCLKMFYNCKKNVKTIKNSGTFGIQNSGS